jgi:hypothetical protein
MKKKKKGAKRAYTQRFICMCMWLFLLLPSFLFFLLKATTRPTRPHGRAFALAWQRKGGCVPVLLFVGVAQGFFRLELSEGGQVGG